MKLMKLASQSEKSDGSSTNGPPACIIAWTRMSTCPRINSDTNMAGYAIAANAVPNTSCNGTAITSGRHCTRSDAQKETITTGSNSKCCSTRASQGANTSMSVARAIPTRMLYAYSTFDSVTYSQNSPTIAENRRGRKP